MGESTIALSIMFWEVKGVKHVTRYVETARTGNKGFPQYIHGEDTLGGSWS